MRRCVDRGPSEFYRYRVEGRNDNDGCAFSWSVPDLDQRFYWAPDAAECPRYDWDVDTHTGLPAAGEGSTHVFARIVRRRLERYTETIVQLDTPFGRYAITQWFEYNEPMSAQYHPDKFSAVGSSHLPRDVARNLFNECLRLERESAQ